MHKGEEKDIKEEKYYYKFVSYTDGSGYCKGLRIYLLTPSEVERRRKCGEIYERVDKNDKKKRKNSLNKTNIL